MTHPKVQIAINSLTKFHKEHLPVDSSYQKLMETYADVIDMLGQDYRYVKQSLNIQTAPLLRMIPYALLNVSDAWYSKEMARIIKQKNNFDDIITELNRYNFFSSFLFDTPFEESLVYNLRLKERLDSSNELQFKTDFFLHNNRLYLLPDYILSKFKPLSELHAFDIAVNHFTIEKNFGDVFGLRFGHLLTQAEIRNAVRAFHEVHATDLTIKSLKEAIMSATGWYYLDGAGDIQPDFNIQDIVSPDLPVAKKRLYDEQIISPLTFLVSLPEKFSNNSIAVADQSRTAVAVYLLDMVKEAHVNYFVFYDVLRIDKLNFKDSYFASAKSLTSMEESPTFASRQIGASDPFVHYYDGKLPDLDYDSPSMTGEFYDQVVTNIETPLSNSEPVGFYNPSLTAHIGDAFTVRFSSFPYIPSNIVVTGTGASNRTITVSHLNSADAGDEIELYRSTSAMGTYTLIQTKTRNATSTSFTDSPSGLVYYKARSKTGVSYSHFTKIVATFSGSGPAPFYLYDEEPLLTYDGTHDSYDL